MAGDHILPSHLCLSPTSSLEINDKFQLKLPSCSLSVTPAEPIHFMCYTFNKSTNYYGEILY